MASDEECDLHCGTPEQGMSVLNMFPLPFSL